MGTAPHAVYLKRGCAYSLAAPQEPTVSASGSTMSPSMGRETDDQALHFWENDPS